MADSEIVIGWDGRDSAGDQPVQRDISTTAGQGVFSSAA